MLDNYNTLHSQTRSKRDQAMQIEKQPFRKIQIGAWVIYDMADTLFFTGITGLLFPLWLTNELGNTDATFGYTLSISMALVAIISPFAGSLSDRLGKRKPLLAISVLMGSIPIILLNEWNLFIILGMFIIAFTGISVGTIFYNALLVEVSTKNNRGQISGIGIGIGYFGAVIAVAIGIIVVEEMGHGYIATFRIIGILFIILSLPIFLFLKEKTTIKQNNSHSSLYLETIGQITNSLKNIRHFPELSLFLVARFWYMWAAYTAMFFAALYATGSIGLSAYHTELILLTGIIVAIPSGIIWGRIVDLIGPRWSLQIVLCGWVFILLIAALIPLLELPQELWWAFGIFVGLLCAGLWAADRPYMIILTPRENLGEFFGLHSMVGKLSAVIGPFSWGFISQTLGLGQPIAVLSLMACVGISYFIIVLAYRMHKQKR